MEFCCETLSAWNFLLNSFKAAGQDELEAHLSWSLTQSPMS